MKFLKLTASEISGKIKAPSSKSMMQRALAAALLDGSRSLIRHITPSNDARAGMDVIARLGARVEVSGDQAEVSGGINPVSDELNCGESGLGIRMFTPVASLCDRRLTITGEGSLLARPVAMMEEPLKALGVWTATRSGYPPLVIQGPLKGGQASVDGTVSSQFLTGLLMALPKAGGDSLLQVKNLKSTPYVDMTLSMLARCGVRVENRDYREFFIPGGQVYRLGEYAVEGDWSGAAFPLVAGALGGSVVVTGLDPRSVQADRRIMEALAAAGAETAILGDGVSVTRKELRGFEFDATHCPDLFPPLVALACGCSGITRLWGVGRLIHKESNRAESLQKEFHALGGLIRLGVGAREDMMEIEGGRLRGGVLDSHNDHRIAMAGALAAILSDGAVVIMDPDCAAKSYPDFFSDFSAIGGIIHE